jgi:hypothetical protein
MNSLLTNGNYFFTAVFAVESSVKLFAMSPRYFFAVCFFFFVIFISFDLFRMDGTALTLLLWPFHLWRFCLKV